MKHYILESCVESVESALAAAAGGADRLELCGNLIIGGTTPSQGLFQEIRKNSDIRIHALIRPRFGDFYYTEYEADVIRDDILRFRELGAEGVVIGSLNADGSLNMPQMERFMEAAEGMSVTLHRAFDVCRDPYEALKEAEELGIHTILTSGQKNSCSAGKELIKDLVETAGDKIEIMAGSGVDAKVIKAVGAYIGAPAFHMSGKVTLDSAMIYRKEGVNMGLPSISEFELWRTQESKIREARQVLDEMGQA